MVSMEMAATLSVTPMTIVSVFSECPYGFYGDVCHPVCDSYDYCVYVFRVSLWFLWRRLPLHLLLCGQLFLSPHHWCL